MRIARIPENQIPSFCWDRNWTVGEIRTRIHHASGFERIRLMSWVLREGTFDEMWSILTPQQVFPLLSELLPFLGRRKEYWSYTFGVWHKLGKV